MDRRKFTKITLAASGAVALSGCFPIDNKWPKNYMGGDEKLFLNEQDFTRIRENVNQFDWAKIRFEVLRTNALMTEDDFYQSHWKGNWRQWTTGQYLKYVALYYRLTGEEKNLAQIKTLLTQEFNLDRMEKPLYDSQKAVSSAMWSWGM